jgi:hypothetical protein
MSTDYEGKDPLELAAQAERDINNYQAKTGNARAGASDSSESLFISSKSTDLCMQTEKNLSSLWEYFR